MNKRAWKSHISGDYDGEAINIYLLGSVNITPPIQELRNDTDLTVQGS